MKAKTVQVISKNNEAYIHDNVYKTRFDDIFFIIETFEADIIRYAKGEIFQIYECHGDGISTTTPKDNKEKVSDGD